LVDFDQSIQVELIFLIVLLVDNSDPEYTS
jgi:hypothetical protein